MSDTYEVYPAGGPEPRPEPEAGPGEPWYVMVEYSNGGQAKPPTIVQVVGGPFDARDDARQTARHQAEAFTPPDPMNPRRRVVYRTGDHDDELVTFVEGAMSTFHFRTFTAQLVASSDDRAVR